VAAGVLGALVLAAAGAGVAALKGSAGGSKGKNASSYSDVGLDAKKPDADQMIASVAGLATKWKKDASWWGVNFLSVNADGVVDVSKGATVEYVSLSSAKSFAASTNKDSIKEFVFGPNSINYNRITGVRDAKQWQDAKPLATPRCSIKQLVQSLKAKGLTGSKTVRVTYDAQFGFAGPAEPSWRVIGDDPKIDSYFSMATCAQTK
jgi:hypothetical protein